MTPYLSFCLGIGGDLTQDLLDRLDASTNNTLALADKCGLACEIVVAQWNVPSDSHSVNVHLTQKYGNPVRIIRVPRALHFQVPNPHGFRYFEMRPKNIAIRRSRGEFVLSCNPDDLFSEEMISCFARRLLQKGHFYRANRHDTKDGKVYRVCYATGCKPPNATEQQIRTPEPGAAPWSENMIHYCASGDFCLMSRDDWFKIHGNPEREYNNSVDGQTLWLAHLEGLKQVVLKYPFYHPDHNRTLNIAGNGKPYSPDWNDNFPFTQKNDESWGFAGMDFEEDVLL